MKQFFCLIMLAFLFFMNSSCSSSEKNGVSEDDNSLNSTDNIIAGPLEPYDFTVNVSIEKLEFVSSEKKFTFQGDVISKDDGPDFEKIISSFAEHKENGNLVPGAPTELELQFTNAIPQSVTWYDVYVRDGDIAYPSLSKPRSVDHIAAKTLLPIGMNFAIGLDSDSNASYPYKVIRIVCDFDNQIVEYNVFFDSSTVESSK